MCHNRLAAAVIVARKLSHGYNRAADRGTLHEGRFAPSNDAPKTVKFRILTATLLAIIFTASPCEHITKGTSSDIFLIGFLKFILWFVILEGIENSLSEAPARVAIKTSNLQADSWCFVIDLMVTWQPSTLHDLTKWLHGA